MSNVVDQRTVEMRFDNKDFEKNVETSLGTIDKLKKSLNFDESVDSLNGFQKALKSFSLDDISKSVSSLDKSFTTLFKDMTKVFAIKEGIRAFDTLKNTIISVTKSVTGLEQAQAGLTKYWQKTQAVQTIMAATGKSIDDVSAQLDKLNWYTDETSFNFVDMVENIGKFTSAGIDLEDAVRSMEGIANWASTSGRGVTEASRAMYNLAQAIGVGSVKLMDWKSIQNANMDTMEFKETVMETALELGNLKKVGEDYYTTIGKKQKVTAENFASTLSTGWFNSKLLIEVLNRYAEFTEQVYTFMDENPEFDTASDAMDEMRKRAEDAGEAFDELGYKWFISAQEAKTFEDAVNAVKDAVSTGWMNTFELIFGNYEQARELWTDLANELYDLFAVSGTKRNEFLYEVMTSGYEKLKKEITAAGLSVEEFENKLTESFKATEDGKDYLQDLIDEYGSLARALDRGGVDSSWISRTFDELIRSGRAAGDTVPTLEKVEQIVKDTFAGKYGVGKERQEAYEKLGYSYEALQKLVNKFSHTGEIKLEDLEEVGIEVSETLSETWQSFVEDNEDLINSLDKLSGRELIIQSFWNVFKGATGIINSVKEGFSSVFKISPEAAHIALENLYKFTSYLNLSEGSLEKVKNLVTAMVSPLKSIAVVGKRFVDAVIGNAIEKRLPQVKQKITDIFDNIYTYQRRVAKLFKSLETSAYVNKAIVQSSRQIRAFVSDVLNVFRDTRAKFNTAFSDNFITKRLGSLKRQWDSAWNKVNTGGKNGLDTVIQAGKEFWTQWKQLHPDDWNPIPALLDDMQKDFLRLKRWFRSTEIGSILSKYWIQVKTAFLGAKTRISQGENPYVVIWDYLNEGFLYLKRKIRATKIGGMLSAKWQEIKKQLLDGKAIFDKIRQNPFSVVWDFFNKAMLDLKRKFRATKIGSFLSSIWMQIKNAFGKKDTKVKGSLSGGGLFENFLQNVELSFDYLKNRFKESWIGKKLQPIADTIRSVFDKYFGTYDSFGKVKGGTKTRAGKTVDAIAEKFLGFTSKSFADGIKGALVNDRAMSYLNRIPIMFGKVKDKIVGEALSLKSKIDGLWTSYKETGFHKVLQDFWNWSRPLLKTLTEKLVNNFSYKDVSDLFKSLAAFNLSKLSKNLGNFIKDFNKQFKEGKTLETITESLSEFFKGNSLASAVATFTDGATTITKAITDGLQPLADAITGNFKAISTELKGRTVLEIAGAIALVSGSLWLLSRTNVKDLQQAGIAVGAIVAALAGLTLALSKVSSTSFEPKAYGQIVAMSIALVLISAAVRNLVKAAQGLKDYNWEELGKSIAGVLALMFGSLEIIHLFRFTNVKHSLSIISSLLALAFALKLIVGAVKEIANLGFNKNTLAGVLGVAGLIAALAGAMTLIGITGGPIFIGTALAILAMAGAIRIMVSAVRDFSEISKNRDEFAKSITAVIGLITALGVGVLAAGWGPANIFGGTALTILAMAAAIRVMVKAVKEFALMANMPEMDLDKAVDAVGRLLESLSDAVRDSGWTFASFGKAATVFAFVGAIYALQNAVKSFAEIPYGNLKKSIDAITELLSALKWAVFVSGFTFASLGGAATVLAFGKAIQWISDSISTLADIAVNKDRLEVATKTIKGFITLITGVSVLLGIMNRIGAGASLGQAAMIAAFGLSLKWIGETLAELSKIDSENLKKAGFVVTAIGVVMTIFMRTLGNMKIGVLSGIGNAGAILSFANAVNIIANALIKLSEIDEDALKRGGFAIGQVIAVMSGVMVVLSKNPLTSSVKTVGMNFVAFAAALAIIAFTIEKLGALELTQLGKGVAAMSFLMIALGIMTKLSSQSASVSTFENAATIVANAMACWILAQAIVKVSEVPWKKLLASAATIAGLLTVVVLLGKITRASNDIKSAISLTILAGAVGILAYVAKTFADMEWGDLAKVASALGGMTLAMAAIAKFVNIGIQSISLAAIAKLGLAVAEVGAILAILGGFFKFGPVADLMSSGVDFLKTLGRALGGFFGAIVGGFREGVAESMPAVGTALSDFATNANGFFEMLEKFDKFDPLDALSSLSKALSDVTWNEIKGKIFNLFSEDKTPQFTSLEAFGNGLKAFAPGFQAFLESFDEKDTTNLGNVTDAIQKLSTVAQEQEYVADNPLQTFGEALKTASEPMKEGIEAWNAIPTPNSNANSVISFLEEIAGIKLPESISVGITGIPFVAFWFDYGTDFKEFCSSLSGAMGDIKTFIEGTNELEFTYQYGKTKAALLAEVLTSLAKIDVPPSGGIVAAWANYKTAFTQFAKDISGSMTDLGTFISSANDMPAYDQSKVDAIIDIISSMASIDVVVPRDDVYLTYSGLVDAFIVANDQINSLAGAIDESNLDKVSTLLSYLDKDANKVIDTSFIDAVPVKIRAFTDSMQGLTLDESLSRGLEAISTILTPIENLKDLGFTDVATDITSGINNLASIVGDGTLTLANQTVTAFSDFVYRIFRVQTNFDKTTFAENLGDAITAINEKFAVMHDPGLKVTKLKELFMSIQGLYDLDFVKGSKGNQIANAFNALSRAVDSFEPNDDKVDEINWYKTWLESFGGENGGVPDFTGWEEAFGNVASIIDSFTTDTSKFDSISKFLELLQNEFKSPKGTIGKDKNYFENIGKDLVKMDKELEKADFAKTIEISSTIQDFATSIRGLFEMNPETFKSRFSEILKAVNNAILGEGTEEVPGIDDSITGKLDPIYTLFDKLNEFNTAGLTTIIPDTLASITSAINNFTYDESSLQRLEYAITQIATDLGLLDPSSGLPTMGSGMKGGLASAVTGGRGKVSKVEELINKLTNRSDDQTNVFDGFIDSINNVDIDPTKADFLIDIAESIENAAEGVVLSGDSAFEKFVQAIADSIRENSVKTDEAGRNLAEGMIIVFEDFYDKFFIVGQMFVEKISDGMRVGSIIAMETAATVATNIISRFDKTIEEGENSGEKFANNFATGLLSDESSSVIQDAIKHLFMPDEDVQQSGEETFSAGKLYGEKFVTDFQEGLSITGDGLATSLNAVFTSFGENFDLTAMATTITESVEMVQEQLEEPIGMINSTLSKAVPNGAGLANAMIDGIIAVLKERVVEACEEMALFASAVAGAAKGALGIASPSKVFYKIGENVVEGFVNAIEDDTTKAKGAMQDLVSTSTLANATELFKDFENENSGLFAKIFTNSDLDEVKSKLDILHDYVNDSIPEKPNITPVINYGGMKASLDRIPSEKELNFINRSSKLSSKAADSFVRNTANNIPEKSVPASQTFIQNNYSPKALSRIEIYRQTKNQFAQMKEMTT